MWGRTVNEKTKLLTERTNLQKINEQKDNLMEISAIKNNNLNLIFVYMCICDYAF